ncbi:MAG: ribbon-helix-helix protein, CopG family [Thermoplasmata archaeon]|nr:ribbon-helix-helix protein, CopG family [Thermoplasmata archaeon]
MKHEVWRINNGGKTMTAKGKDTEILSFSVPSQQARDLEKLAQEIGYSNRSELIRDALHLFTKSKMDTDQLSGKVEGIIITLYDHAAEPEVSEIRHRNMDIIKSFMHTDFRESSESCCDILIFSGMAEKVKTMVYDIGSSKKVNEVKLFIA